MPKKNRNDWDGTHDFEIAQGDVGVETSTMIGEPLPGRRRVPRRTRSGRSGTCDSPVSGLVERMAAVYVPSTVPAFFPDRPERSTALLSFLEVLLMRLSIAVLVAGLLWISAPPAVFGQPDLRVRGYAGASWFRSPDRQGSVLDPGVDLGLGVGWDVYRGAEITLEGAFAHFAGNENELGLSLAGQFPGPSLDVTGGDVFAWTAAAGLRYTFRNPSAAHPYVAAALTYSAYRAQSAEVLIDRGDAGQIRRRVPRSDLAAFGYQAAIGVSFQVSRRMAVFVEPRLSIVRTQDDRFVLQCEEPDCQDSAPIGILTRSDQSTVFVPVRLGVRFRPWGAPFPVEEESP